MKGCLSEFVIGMVILGIMAVVLSVYGFPAGNELARDASTALPGLVILGGLVLVAAGFLVKSSMRAESIGIPGAGCGYYLALFALAVIVIGFFVAGTMATLGE